MVDLRDVPLIDEHVHIFAPDAARSGFDPLATFTLGGDDPGFLEADGRVGAVTWTKAGPPAPDDVAIFEALISHIRFEPMPTPAS